MRSSDRERQGTSSYPVGVRGAQEVESPEKKGCEDEWQARADPGSWKRDGIRRLDAICRSVVCMQFRGENGQHGRSGITATGSLRNAALYFHMETPPLFKIYRIPLEESEDPGKTVSRCSRRTCSCWRPA